MDDRIIDIQEDGKQLLVFLHRGWRIGIGTPISYAHCFHVNNEQELKEKILKVETCRCHSCEKPYQDGKMTNSDFTRLLTQASKTALKLKSLLNKVDIEAEKRHGYFPSQLDCEEIIKIIYQGGNGMTARQFDDCMKRAIESKKEALDKN